LNGPALTWLLEHPHLRALLLGVGGAAAIALLVHGFGAPTSLALLAAPLGAAAFMRWPHAATGLTTFLLYINFPAILTKQVGLPAPLAGAFILLLAFPLVYLLLIRRERFRVDATFALMLAFCAVLALASLRAVDADVALRHVVQFATEGLLLYWLFVNVVRTRAVLQRVVLMALAGGALTSGLSLYQEVTGSYHQEFGGLAYRNYVPEQSADTEAEEQVRRRSSHRAQGPTDEPNRYAQTLIVLLPLAVMSWRSATTGATRHLAAGAGFLILAGVALTLSRGAFLNLLVMAGAMTALRWIRPAHLAVALVAATLLVPVLSPQFVPRMLSIANVRHLAADDPASRTAADGAIRGRTTSMLTSLHVFRDHPLVGVGPGQFRFYYSAYSDNPDIRFRAIQGSRRAHNLYLEIAAETGILGLGVFMAILLGLVWRLWRIRMRAESLHSADLATAFVLSLVAYLGTGIFLHLAFQQYLWLLVALAGAAVHVLAREVPPASAPPSRSAQRASRVHAEVPA
jgi:putative inorganic carbon (hco3(-)) transporter